MVAIFWIGRKPRCGDPPAIGTMKNRTAHQSPLFRSCNLLMPTISEETTRTAKKITNSSQLNTKERMREIRPPR